MIINAQRHVIAYFNIRKILQKIEYQPQGIKEKLAYSIIYSNIDIQNVRQKSHLADSIPLEGQIQFLLQSELKNLLRVLIMSLPPQKIIIYNSTTLSKSEQYFFALCKEFNPPFEITLRETFREIWPEEISLLTEEEQKVLDLLEDHTLLKEKDEQVLLAVITCAKRAIYNKDYQTAIELLHKIEPHYRHPSISWFLGIGYNFFGETQVSEKYFYQVYHSDDVDRKINACYTLSMLYLRHHPKDLIDIEKGKELLDEALKLIESAPTSTDVVFNRVFNRTGYAFYLYRKNRIDEAIKLLNWGIEQLKSSDFLAVPLHISVLYYNLFQCHRAQGNLEQQLKALDALLELDPKFEVYLLEKAIVCNQLDLLIDAIGILVDVLILNPYNDIAQSLLGKCYYDQGQMEQAEKHFYNAVQLVPSNTKYLYDLFLVLRLRRKNEMILKVVDELALNCWDVEDSAIVLMYAEALAQSPQNSNYQKARTILKTYLQKHPNESQVEKALVVL